MDSYDPLHREPRPGGFNEAPRIWPWLLCLLIGGALGFFAYRFFIDRGHPAAEPRPVTARGDLQTLEKSNIEIFRKTKPSVIYITTLAERVDPFTLNVTEYPRGTGSGFIWDDGGDVVTNFHVVEDYVRSGGAGRLTVTLDDRSSYEAQVIGVAPDQDLAVVRIAAPKAKLVPVLIGTSDDLQVGQAVYAIGNPFGLNQTLTTGIVSALGRSIKSITGRDIEDVIQTDAAINPGNSGGPLLDSAGRLIGVNTAIYSPSGASAGVGFAIPVDTVNRVVPQLIKNGKVTRPKLGVVMGRLQGIEGALVLKVNPNTPAEKAGLQGTRLDARRRPIPGDIIVAIDKKPVRTPDDLNAYLEKRNPGDTVTLTIIRQDQKQDVPVQLGAPE